MLQLVGGGAQSLRSLTVGPALLRVTPLSLCETLDPLYLTINLHVLRYKNIENRSTWCVY